MLADPVPGHAMLLLLPLPLPSHLFKEEVHAIIERHKEAQRVRLEVVRDRDLDARGQRRVRGEARRRRVDDLALARLGAATVQALAKRRR